MKPATVRVAFVSDSHFDVRNRFGECVRVHNWILQDAIARGCQIMLHGGDIFDRRATAREASEAARWLRGVCRHMPVVIVRGNHDLPSDLHAMACISGAWSVLAINSASSHLVECPSGAVEVIGVPWPTIFETPGSATVNAAARQELRSEMRRLGRGISPVPKIVLAHAMVRGVPQTTEAEPKDENVEMELDDFLVASPSIALLGHIHARQSWTRDGTSIVYPGTPKRMRFADIEPKGYVVADVGPTASSTTWGHIRAPLAPLHHIEWNVADGMPDVPEVGDADVRLRYHASRAEGRDGKFQAKALADSLTQDGAVSVEIESVFEEGGAEPSLTRPRSSTVEQRLLDPRVGGSTPSGDTRCLTLEDDE